MLEDVKKDHRTLLRGGNMKTTRNISITGLQSRYVTWDLNPGCLASEPALLTMSTHKDKVLFGDNNWDDTGKDTGSVRLNLRGNPQPQIFREAFHGPNGVYAGAAVTKVDMALNCVELTVHLVSPTASVFIHRMGIRAPLHPVVE